MTITKNVVTIRDFQRNFYKHIRLKEDIVVTIKGKEAFQVSFTKDNVVTSNKVVTSDVVTKVDRVTQAKNILNSYGCGCEKEAGNPICSKHNRY